MSRDAKVCHKDGDKDKDRYMQNYFVIGVKSVLFLSTGAICTITHFTNFATSSSIMFYFRDNRFHKLCVLGVFFG